MYFTPVCTTEMIAFTRAHTYFKDLNTELLGLSVDSNSSHEAYQILPIKIAITCRIMLKLKNTKHFREKSKVFL